MRELLSPLSDVGFGQASLRCRSYTGVLVEVGHEPARGMHAEVGDVGKKNTIAFSAKTLNQLLLTSLDLMLSQRT